MAKIEQYFFPIMAGAAVIGIYVFLKRPQPQQVSNQPNTSASGLPQYTPQAQTYQVNPPQLSAPSGITLLSDPFAQAPGTQTQQKPPQYLAFNFGPGHDLTKVPPSVTGRGGNGGMNQGGGGCGCDSCDSCNPPGILNQFTDGQGSVCMSSSKQRQVDSSNPMSWIQNALNNLMGSGIDFGALDPTQTLQSFMPGLEGGYDVPAAPASAIPISAPGSGVDKRTIGGPRITPAEVAPTPLGGGKFGRDTHTGVGYGNPQGVGPVVTPYTTSIQ